MATHQLPPAGPCVLIIFGASGDLTKRLLMPALYNLQTLNLLPENFAIVGVARRPLGNGVFQEQLSQSVRELGTQAVKEEVWTKFSSQLHYHAGDFDNSQTYEGLKKLLEEIDTKHGTGGNYLFYLATQASSFGPIAEELGKAGLLKRSHDHWRRVIVEKPFGTDLPSAIELNEQLSRVMREDQIYRIDHYLGKETVQNLLVLRFGNALFEPTWNRNHIDHVQITVAEAIGVGTRGAFYETAGALRDVLENHIFMILTLVCMEPPSVLKGDAVRNEMVKVIESIRPFADAEHVAANAVRGQYGEGDADGKHLAAYNKSPNVAPDSSVETYAALKLEVANWRWAGVPFYLRTGKGLAARRTQIVIEFKQAPLRLFAHDDGGANLTPNRLILDLQPKQGITMQFRAKIPGAAMNTKSVKLNFDYKDEFGNVPRAVGYETLLYDAMIGDNTLFHRTDMVEAAWRVATPVLEAWSKAKATDFPNYAAGSQGPAAADEMLSRDGRKWWPIE